MNYKKEIDARGLKISWLAEKIGVSQPMLTLFIQGKRNLRFETETHLKQLLK